MPNGFQSSTKGIFIGRGYPNNIMILFDYRCPSLFVHDCHYTGATFLRVHFCTKTIDFGAFLHQADCLLGII